MSKASGEYAQASWPSEQWPELFAQEYRQMPDDWYPAELFIYGKHEPYELGCSIPLTADGQVDAEKLVHAIKALRQAFWLKIETDRFQLQAQTQLPFPHTKER